MFSPPEFFPFEKLWSWGWNDGNLGFKNDGGNVAEPALMEGLKEEIRLVACGGSHTIVVTDSNRMFAVGKNEFGQCGVGHTKNCPTFTEVKSDFITNDDPLVQVACGDQHSVALTTKGVVLVWGKNFQYQLGVGMDKSPVLKPKKNTSLSAKKIHRIACGSRHSVFVDLDGEILSCGYGKYGQLGHGDNLPQPFPKRIDPNESGGTAFKCIELKSRGYLNVALSSKYEVWIWGGKKYVEENLKMYTKEKDWGNNLPRKIFGNLNGRRVIDIACSSLHGLALTSDGSVYGYGHQLCNLGYTYWLPTIIKQAEEYDDQKKKPLTGTAKEIAALKLDLSKKYVVPGHHGFSIFKNHFFKENEIMQICCGETANYAVSRKGEVFCWGPSSDKLEMTTKLALNRPKQLIKELGDVYVARIEAGPWNVVALQGKIENFQHRHMELGQKIPKCLAKLPKTREEIE